LLTETRNEKHPTDGGESEKERERKQLSVISRQPIGGVHYSGRVWCGVTLVFRDGTILDLQALCVKGQLRHQGGPVALLASVLQGQAEGKEGNR
jgi:hypothetical protein